MITYVKMGPVENQKSEVYLHLFHSIPHTHILVGLFPYCTFLWAQYSSPTPSNPTLRSFIQMIV